MPTISTQEPAASGAAREAAKPAPAGGQYVFPSVAGGPLTQKEYNSRIVHSKHPRDIQVVPETGAPYTLRYAYVCQRGYYPESPNKENQDSFIVIEDFTGSRQDHFFGVFDGHGDYGAPCSQFARKWVPENIARNPNFQTDLYKTYNKAFTDTNLQLHRQPIDDTMSGTTAITVHIRGTKAHVANVGDSRAIMSEKVGNRLVARDLSCDQTPFRADECARVKKEGARVLTLDQLEGLKNPNIQCWGTEEDDDGDPPRLWAPNGMYPGTAFTRSIGDSAAERIGVFAEPEIMSVDITSDTKHLIIASDGVFEFLSSQAVVDLVSKFEDPLEAAMACVAESYRLWLQFETRTDDITIIIIQIHGVQDGPKAPQQSISFRMPAGPAAPPPRPVRRQIARSKRAEIEACLDDGEDAGPIPEPTGPKKTPQEAQQLTSAIRANFLFNHLSDAQREKLILHFTKRTVKKGELVIRQGEAGDAFFIVSSGKYRVYVLEPGRPPANDGLGEVTYEYDYEFGNVPPAFGELALLYNQKRTASVKALTDGSLWVLDRRSFKASLKKSDSKALIKILKGVEVLASMRISQLQRLADMLAEVWYQDGEVIIKQGDPGNEFFILVSGEAVVTHKRNIADAKEVPKEIMNLKPNQTFGERALLSNAPRSASVTAKGKVKVLQISRQTFEEVLGPLQHIINADRKWRDKANRQKDAVARLPTVSALRGLTSADLGPCEALWTSDCSQLAICSLKGDKGGATATVRQTSISLAVELGRQATIMRERALAQVITPMPYIPAVMKTMRDGRWLTAVLQTNAFSTLEHLLQAPLREESVAHYAASAALMLEHVHNHSVVLRGLAPNTLLVDEDGHIQLVDFRFAKRLEGQGHTFTLCGNPEYLSPEVVAMAGHDENTDWWSLGVLMYYMFTLETPFAKHGDQEIEIYRRIKERQFTFPAGVPASARPVIEALLAMDPHQRPHLKDLQGMAFFKSVNWEVLSSVMIDEVPVPEEIQDLVRAHKQQPVAVPALEGVQPYSGPADWFNDF